MLALGVAATLVALPACKRGSAAASDAGAAEDASAKEASARARANRDDDEADAAMLDTIMPGPPTEELALRMRHLLEAIAQNNPDLASDIVFPRDAYIAWKDSPDPQKAWDRQLAGAFKRAVDRTHRKNKGIEDAKFVGYELGRPVTQVSPKRKDLKVPVWRVKDSRLSYSVDGKTKHIEIAEMTAWRGAWYVTRLR
jgi:hypothetical protein